MTEETIVAPTTPPGISAIAALRVSGPQVKAVIQKLLPKANLQPRVAKLASAFDPGTGVKIDTPLCIFFEAPASYTGEDVLEIFPHGNPLLVRDLLRAALEVEGVRLAEPGEFTKRAFLNGKLDLVQAKAVGDLIHGTSAAALGNARKMFSGEFSKVVSELAASVLDFSARVELEVDFAEEEVDADVSGWDENLAELLARLELLLSRFRSIDAMNRLPMVVVYGAPNVGKSSLVNALLGEDRLLVSGIAGTTRDFVETRIMLAGGEIRLVDTAGISDAPTSELDALSMERSRKILAEADFKIFLTETAVEGYSTLDDEILVYSKSDLHEAPFGSVSVSAKTGAGIPELRELLNEKLYPKQPIEGEAFWVTSERERLCLEAAAAGVRRAMNLLKTNPAVELLAFEMQTVRRELLSITGELSSESVLQAIFSGFCIGK